MPLGALASPAMCILWLLFAWLACPLTMACLPWTNCDADNHGLSLLQRERSALDGHTLTLEYASQRLLLHVRIGNLPVRRLLLDTGSSTVAFCNTSFPEVLPLSEQTQLNACEQYGPSTPNGFFTNGYVGPFFRGELSIQGPAGRSLQIPNAMYAVFAEGSCAPEMCTDKPSEGIFGVAYRKRSMAYPSSVDLSSSCSSIGNDVEVLCPSTSASVLSPLMQELRMTPQGWEIFGVYWSGGLTGNMYLGPAATRTIHYNPFAPPARLLDAGSGASGWYNVNVWKIVYDDVEFTQIDCTKHSRACIIDTGTPVLLLPSVARNWPDPSKSSKIEFHLEGASGSPSVVIDFNFSKLMSEGSVGILNPPQAFWDPLLVIGLPLWAHYYTMFNITGDTISFTRH